MKSPHTCFSLAVLLIVVFASSVFGRDAAKKTPFPTDAAQAEATKLIKEIYGDEWAKAKTSAERQALAKKLLGKASESKDDPASQFVLLRLARDIATQASDGQTAFQAIDAMAETFQADSLEMKSAVLARFASAAEKPAQHKSISSEALKLVDQAVSQDNFTVADRLGTLALAEAQKARDKDLIAQTQGRVAEVAELAKAYEEVQKAGVTLKTIPDDPEANLVVGKYQCFAKGNWDKGVPMLALGKDDTLKALAQQELQGAASLTEQTKLGDGWWSLAEKEEGTTKKQIQGRAGYWYQKALPGLSGLMKDKVEKRIALLGNSSQLSQDLPVGDGLGSEEVRFRKSVVLGLKWLARQQTADGSWSFTAHPSRKASSSNAATKTRSKKKGQNKVIPGRAADKPATFSNDVAATALSLLPFLHAGTTDKNGEHSLVVAKGLNYIQRRMEKGGDLRAGGPQGMYVQGLASIAICEAYLRSQDIRIRPLAQQAVDFIVSAQDPNGGGWRYNPRDPGDTSVLGWQLTALSVARSARLRVPQQTFLKAAAYLDRVQSDNGMSYAYMPGTAPSSSMSAAGLLCRTYFGWSRNTPALQSGVKKWCNSIGPDVNNMYYTYYATRLMRSFGGDEWQQWQRDIRKKIIERQDQEGAEAGSWSGDTDAWGKRMGERLGQTAFSLMTLEAGSDESRETKKE